ncbi:MAG: RNA polymerase sigma factor [Elusimicrobia bacterium]|nr:RNA polymerase sigma factor [Elusimicrobiota bacterium]
MTTETDRLLVQRCLGGDARAFEELLENYKNQIYSFIRRLIENPQDAEDQTQETFIKAFRRLDSYDPAYPFITWLFRIAHNASVDFLRAKRPQTVSIDDEDAPLELEDKGDCVETAVSVKMETERAERLLASLPPLYREILLLKYHEELTGREMAEVLGIPEGTVKIRLFRARALMREKFNAMARPETAEKSNAVKNFCRKNF